ncbi:MAP/microtubule affinity-regulating kinase 4-like [Rousettus aegyptiacus]|nr:MAP/microtubule affinity-regulating kinase 4-like [Rousettus aegyptiacus]
MPHDLAATSPITEPRIGHYQLLHTIGKGAFGVVKLARHIITGVEVAVKAIDRQGAYRPGEEVRNMKSLNHPHIIKLYQVIATEDTIFIVMEHASRGSLSEYLQSCGRMSEPKARRITRQLISAVHYCHQKNIIHRDLKAENVLLDAELNAKLTDFGLSSRTKEVCELCQRSVHGGEISTVSGISMAFRSIVPWTMEVCELCQRSVHGSEISMVSGIFVAFSSIIPW